MKKMEHGKAKNSISIIKKKYVGGKKNKKTPWSESASELYQPSDRRLLTK
jgi:hypothetical protein